MAESTFIFITGGVRSGKSSFAEKQAIKLASKTGGRLCYLATGVASDPEMQERIGKHQRDRLTGGYQWKTYEQSVQIGKIANDFKAEDVVLLDCLTTLLNNELFSSEQKWDERFLTTVKDTILTGITSIKERVGTMLIVSNEVLNESLFGNEMVFTYGRLLGQVHQYLVKEADQVFLVEAGIPIVIKGAIS
ncbi:bifunctional adenosylcobinamide kinase/adenosylcobinamide-phosphate guanylyltransferase [Neobacillus sp. MER 74]|uniref:bifunctional adenosylcobinamide kinase/adenosylcobinamide-phosphate guanylyltransferase n=1 Tax=unclassified Neobacillus TaxID=2675272 RepID=UPI00203A5E1D|nr:bifunctional adenosylcobinamide kinase/adenosylcobinamide-phosphate guanylyltransferase [Neobacillus sp. MER 74]MCM3116875.1 bifunctional adenosylcobinamide kinase/adenosylcobinamide-phosphate guanylyltransferase [Neobacillus sp. MER 74]